MKRTLKRKVCETVERETDELGILLRNDRKSRQAVILGDQVLTLVIIFITRCKYN